MGVAEGLLTGKGGANDTPVTLPTVPYPTERRQGDWQAETGENRAGRKAGGQRGGHTATGVWSGAGGEELGRKEG